MQALVPARRPNSLCQRCPTRRPAVRRYPPVRCHRARRGRCWPAEWRLVTLGPRRRAGNHGASLSVPVWSPRPRAASLSSLLATPLVVPSEGGTGERLLLGVSVRLVAAGAGCLRTG